MSGTLHCPFCGAELETHYYEYENSRGDTCYGDSGMLMCASYDEGCSSHRKPMLPEIWQALIDGKKAQEDLKYAEEELECAKHNYSVLCEQKKIAYQNYLKITGDLQMQLQKTQEALKVAIDALSKIDTFDCDSKGAIEIMAGMVSIANGALYKITSITKQEK